MKVMLAVPDRPSDRVPTVDPLLEQLALDAISKRKARRPQTVAEFRHRLLEALSPGQAPSTTVARRGLAATATAPDDELEADVLIVEALRSDLDTLAVLLHGQGFAAAATPDVARVEAVVARHPFDAIVIDLRPEDRSLDEVATLRAKVEDRPIIVIGRDDDFDDMRRALALGLSDYIAHSQVHERLGKAIRRAVRRAPPRPSP